MKEDPIEQTGRLFVNIAVLGLIIVEVIVIAGLLTGLAFLVGAVF